MKKPSLKGRNPDKLPVRIYLVLCILFLLFLTYIGIAERPVSRAARQYARESALRDITRTQVKDDDAPAGRYDIYRFTLGTLGSEDLCLAFYTVHADVQVLLSGNVIYSYEASQDNVFGKTPGNSWHMIHLLSSDSGQSMEVRIFPVYRHLPKTRVLFTVGDRADIITREVMSSMPIIVLSMLLFFLSLALLLITFLPVFTGSREDQGRLRSLSVFCLLLGLWQLSDLRMNSLIFSSLNIFIGYLTLSCLILMPFVLISFIRSTIRRHTKAYRTAEYIFLLFAGLILVLQLLGIRDFRECLPVLHALIAAAIAVTVCFSFQDLQRSKNTPRLLVTILSFSAIVASTATDLFRFYQVDTDVHPFFTLLTMLFYLVFCYADYFLRLRRDAVYDKTTGLYNKNYCREKVGSSGAAAPGTVFYMFDLNGLKSVNDERGHEAGDLLIRSFADALKEAAKNLPGSFSGRFGGDEFILIFDSAQAGKEAEAQFLADLAAITEKKKEVLGFPIQYAYGKSSAEEFPGEPLEVLMRKADTAMYLAKKEWYSQPGHNRRRRQEDREQSERI